MSSQVPRQELLEAGRKKLKDYQQKRRSMNTPLTQTQSITLPNKRMSASSLRWRNDKALDFPSTITNASSPTESTIATSPTSFNEEAYPLPPPSIMARPAHHPTPTPTVSTPPPSSSKRNTNSSGDGGGGGKISRSNNSGRSRGHERSQSTLLPPNYASEFPSTWAYANSSHIPLKTTSNMDEALIWIQQNNRLVQENHRLKQELDQVRREKDRLNEKLRYTERKLQQQESLLLLQDTRHHHHHHEKQQQHQAILPPRKALEEER
ncbi:hypothetical protein BDB00DRAFT_823252 [Zychaea mexicana]|uniref:uncharacterized protein n=1 Tax=Zychaea mexicana TaxID=64656 RepID=UPI0022FE2716|nr:uncharacterized protein BDB00DRAFT_823252 [Zychaea mexicana]KAI9493488.1 hypothetical protein BDB00DRAFT_823252 [Zychaea mexicana]